MPPYPGVVTLRRIGPEPIARYALCIQYDSANITDSWEKYRH